MPEPQSQCLRYAVANGSLNIQCTHYKVFGMPSATGRSFVEGLLLFFVIFVFALTAVVLAVSLFMGNWLGSGQAMATPIVNASAKHTATVSADNR